MIKFYIDRCDTTVAGWVFDDEVGSFVDVQIFLDGSCNQAFVANLYRQDLVDAGFRGNCAFSVDLDLDGFDLTRPVKIEIYALSKAAEPFLLHSVTKTLVDKYKIDASGWIFLINDSNRSEDYLTGVLRCQVPVIERSAEKIVSFARKLDGRAIPCKFFVVPDKAVVCNGLRHERLAIIPDRPIYLLRNSLAEMGFWDLIYPVDVFSEDPGKYFLKTDTHLSALGCLKLIDILGDLVPEFFGQKVDFSLIFNENFTGDLGSKCDPRVSEAVFVLDGQTRDNLLIRDDPIPRLLSERAGLTGSKVHLKKREGGRRLLLFGTSSAYYVIYFLIAYFDEICFRWGRPDMVDVDEYSPDYVLCIIPERIIPI